ncbi:MAG: hypothetical protein ACRDL3_05375 [Solirubrobacterales bacterium]
MILRPLGENEGAPSEMPASTTRAIVPPSAFIVETRSPNMNTIRLPAGDHEGWLPAASSCESEPSGEMVEIVPSCEYAMRPFSPGNAAVAALGNAAAAAAVAPSTASPAGER